MSSVPTSDTRATCSLLIFTAARASRRKRTVDVASPDEAALLVDWLNELLYLAEVERVTGRRVLPHVAPELRVRGIDGLRVADASVMPTITSGNTNTPTIMIAERGAELIRSARKA